MTKRPICPTRFPTRKPARKSSRPRSAPGSATGNAPPRKHLPAGLPTRHTTNLSMPASLSSDRKEQELPCTGYSEKPARLKLYQTHNTRIVSFFMQQIRPTPETPCAPGHLRRSQQPTVPPPKSTKRPGDPCLTLRLQYRFSVEYRTTPEANGTRPGVVHPRISNIADHTDRGSKTNRVRSA